MSAADLQAGGMGIEIVRFCSRYADVTGVVAPVPASMVITLRSGETVQDKQCRVIGE